MKKYKILDHELKDIDSKGIVTFYFNAFGNEDSDGDITKEATFSKTIKEGTKRVKHFKNHNYTLAPGVIQELGTDSFGAWARSKMILGTVLGKETYEEYKAGAITEHSFGFDETKQRDNENTKIIQEVKLWEVSSLTHWGANEQTPVIDVKSKENIIEELDKLTKLTKGDFTDEYLKKLENKIQIILKHLNSLTEPESTKESQFTQNEPKGMFDYLNTKF